MRISVRQLLREPKKYLIPGEFILTRKGADFLKVILSELSDKPPVRQDKVSDNNTLSDKCKAPNCEYQPLNSGYCLKHEKLPLKIGNLKGE